jgi:hypothetical protein
MKTTIYLFLSLSVSIYAQDTIEAKKLSETAIYADTLVSVDNFGTIYFIKNDVFYKKNNANSITYSNVQLGKLYSANAFNPLKINLFYKDFNTIIILDNRLAEIYKLDFNEITPYKNVTHVSTGHDNTIWIFNQDLQKLEVFDYKTNTTRAQTVPVNSEVLDLKSNYNYCWLLTQNYLYTYNYFGSLIKKIKNNGYTNLVESHGNIILKKENSLFYIKKNQDNIVPIKTPNLLIKQFFVTTETLYIYNTEILYKYQLKIN